MNTSSLARIAAVILGVSAIGPVAPAVAAPATVAPPAAKTLAVSATFTPNPPPAKGADRIVVSVKDASGRPVGGATVTIATSMPTMSMKGAEFVARESGHGTYTADATLNYATTWAFEIKATSRGRSGTARIEKVLK